MHSSHPKPKPRAKRRKSGDGSVAREVSDSEEEEALMDVSEDVKPLTEFKLYSLSQSPTSHSLHRFTNKRNQDSMLLLDIQGCKR